MLQVCPNGARDRRACPNLPISPAELAAAVREAVAAGATDVHLHPKTPEGADTLIPDHVAAAVTAVREAVPGIPVGVTTGAWAAPDPRQRVELIRSWSVLPDHASVNWHEDGAEEVAEALLERGVGIEAGIFSGTPAPRRFLASPLAGGVLRVLAEVTDTDPRTARAAARTLLGELGDGLRAPVLLHAEDGAAWPVLRLAGELGLATRIGLEDVLELPDGTPATTNAELVRAARAVLGPAH
ncbi:3-keto-5-aminohexanoate cleavage protein [Nonomuraea sp. SMC257]|uniref:3-keto-5-aminohexanoate cleavage protein n=1 Tax=Nonomuraea montanisoli TaxID=2741721 RepID=A0A7Y6I522_9ACTN|nr:3-keto-5-aminohexanoate cleavage protein [Nonomuraea montanisoli]NUW31596.1 3-keto-5-aminohexanoate cleavage protein [Nonomuraea montanisoli]